MTTDQTTFGLLAAIIAAVLSMQWFLLREVRAAMNGLARNVSDLTLVIAIDLATRPGVNDAGRDLARRMVRDRDPLRARELDQEEH